MKKKLSKILNSKNIKIIIPIIMLLVLIIIICIYLKEYKYNQYRDKQEDTFYQYFAGQKVEYEATISYNRKKEIKAFVPKEIKVNYGSTPIYYKEEQKVIFPSEMSIIFPLKKKSQAKIKEFSYIENINNINYLTFEDYKNNIDHYILYDGENQYFFSDNVSFSINEENITLSPMSYVIAKPNEIRYYNYETDEYTTIETSNEIFISNEYYTVNVTNDYINYQDGRLLLTSDLSFLNVITKE